MSLIRRVAGRRVVQARPCPPAAVDPTTKRRRPQGKSADLVHITLDPAEVLSLYYVELCPVLPAGDYEEGLTPRVSFVPAGENAIAAALVALPLAKTYKPDGALRICVYQPEAPCDFYRPTKKEVPDVRVTEEVWVLQPVEVALTQMISAEVTANLLAALAAFWDEVNTEGIDTAIYTFGLPFEAPDIRGPRQYHWSTAQPYLIGLLSSMLEDDE